MSFRPREARACVPAMGVPSASPAMPALSMRLQQVLEIGVKKRDAEGNEIPDAGDVIMKSTGLSRLAVKTVQALATYFVKLSEFLYEWGEGSNMFLPGSNFDTDDLGLLNETFKLYEGSMLLSLGGMEPSIRNPTDIELAAKARRLGLNSFEKQVYMNRLVTVDPYYFPHFMLNAKRLKQLSTNPDKFQLVANTMHWYITSFLPDRQIITALLHMSMNPIIVEINDNHVVKKIVHFKKGELESVLGELQNYFARIRVGVFEPKYNMFAIKDVANVKAADDVGGNFVGPDEMKVSVRV